jgi:hypothetical protein
MDNWTYWMENLVQLSFEGYIRVLGYFFYPVMFSFIIAYVYVRMQSLTAAAVAILVIIAVFGNALVGVEPWITVLHISVALIVTALLLIFIIKRRGG